jgi:predicted regulator of Ras-like GTPase activity (Roadblock/LC7/MglB family)
MEAQLTTAVVLPEHIVRIDRCLQGVLDNSLATCAFLLDRSGQVVAIRGDRHHGQVVLLGALIAGSFASAREIARLLGEEQFQTLFQQGRRQHLLTTAVSGYWLLVIVFGKKTPVGLVRVLSGQAATELTTILQGVNRSEPKSASLGAGFGTSAAKAIDALFGEP